MKEVNGEVRPSLRRELPSAVSTLIGRLEEAGHRADVVGGAVRDLLLGNVPSDYDITTSATPDEIKRAMCGLRTVDTGIKHGTVSVIVDGKSYEITTYRVDGEYRDARHPEHVYFTRELAADLARRDFTINAMAYSPSRGFTDIFGGARDLAARTVRAVGEPRKRFEEDALRILRALRFASRLDFSIEAATAAALDECAPRLSLVSAERIFSELMKLMAGVGAYRVLKEHAPIVLALLPELPELVLLPEELFAAAPAELRFIALFRGVGAAAFESAVVRLKSDARLRARGVFLLENLGAVSTAPIAIKRAIAEHGTDNVRDLFAFAALFGAGQEGEAALDAVLRGGDCCRLADLRIRGEDVVALGARGPRVGAVLAALLDAVITGALPNERAALLAAAVKMVR